MFSNYLKIAWRNLTKNFSFTVIHLMGLTIGTAACLLIFQYISFEYSYDRFHQYAEDIYRVPIRYSEGFSSITKTATNHPGLGPAMKSDFPEVVSFVRLLKPANIGVNLSWSAINNQGNRVTFTEEKIYLADSTFFEVFSFPVLHGDAATMLKQPRSMVVTKDMAIKYFGEVDVLGKTIQMNGGDTWLK